MKSFEAQSQEELTLENQAQEDLRLGKERVANDSTFGLDGTGEAKPVEAGPEIPESIGTETGAKIAGTEKWQTLKESTQNLLKGAYEKIKNSEPVQNALDRFQVWKSNLMAKHFEGKLESANRRQRTANQESDGALASAVASQKTLDDLTVRMEALGIAVPEDARQKALTEVAIAREREKQYGEKATERGKKVAELQGKYESHKQGLDGASERINSRLTAKQESNNAELALQKQKEAELLAEKKQVEEFLQKLDAQHQTFESQVKTMGRGASRKLIEASMKAIATSRERKVRNLRNLGDVLSSIQNEITVLNKKNEALEARKVKPESAQPEVDVPMEAIETPQEVADSAPPRRPVLRRNQVAMG